MNQGNYGRAVAGKQSGSGHISCSRAGSSSTRGSIGCSQEETARERQRGAGEQSQQVQQKSMSVRLPPACKGMTEEQRHCRDRGEGGGRWAREPERGRGVGGDNFHHMHIHKPSKAESA